MKNPHPGSRTEISGSGIQDGNIRVRDPGWKNPDPGWKNPHPGWKNPDPGSGAKHSGSATLLHRKCTVRTAIPDGIFIMRRVFAGMRESLTEVISKSLSKLATQSEGGETVIDETLLS